MGNTNFAVVIFAADFRQLPKVVFSPLTKSDFRQFLNYVTKEVFASKNCSFDNCRKFSFVYGESLSYDMTFGNCQKCTAKFMLSTFIVNNRVTQSLKINYVRISNEERD